MAHSVCPFKWFTDECNHSVMRREKMFLHAVKWFAVQRYTFKCIMNIYSAHIAECSHPSANHLNGHTLCVNTFCISECISDADWFSVIQKQITLRTSQLTYVVTGISIFTGRHLHTYCRVVCQVHVASWWNFYSVTRISKTNFTSSFNMCGYVVQIVQGRETYFWNSPPS